MTDFVAWKPESATARHKNMGWVIAENGCHIWTGAKTPGGYGQVWHNGKLWFLHRLRYELEVGPIPEGLHIDHFFCNNPPCCNPAHLRPVTPRENVLRSSGLTSMLAAKTHCSRGHPLSGDNLDAHVLRRYGTRNCRQCRNAYTRERRARQKKLV